MRRIDKQLPIHLSDSWFYQMQAESRSWQQSGQVYEPSKRIDSIYQSFCAEAGKAEDSVTKELFTLLYSVKPRLSQTENVPATYWYKLMPFLSAVIQSENYAVLKNLCADKEYPAFYAACALQPLWEQLQSRDILRPLLNIAETIQMLREQVKKTLETDAYQNRLRAYRKLQQVENLSKKAQEQLVIGVKSIQQEVSDGVLLALQAAKDTAAVFSAWGDASGNMAGTAYNHELYRKISQNKLLRELTAELGRYRKMLIQKKKTGYVYGRGEKYDLEYGRDITHCLAADLSLLGDSATEPLFLRKYEQGRLSQYRKRQRVPQGDGDMILLLDESSSMRQKQAWAKAVAMVLLDTAVKTRRKFAFVHFSSKDQVKADVFEPGRYTTDDLLSCMQHFYNGGTSFEAPLKAAKKLILTVGFENADIVMITDGECRVSQPFTEDFLLFKAANKVTMTGVLLDEDNPCGENIQPFCDKVLRLSEHTPDDIFLKIMEDKAA